MLSLTSVATLYLAFILPELLYGKDESRKGLSLAFSVLSLRAAGNVTLGICQRKVSARCFLLLRRHEGAVFRLPHSYPYSVIVCQKNSSRLLFPFSFFTMSAPFRHIQRHKREGCILYLQQCTNSYLLLHRTHYGRLDTMKNFLDYCLLHFQTLDGVYKMVFLRLIIASSKAQRGP